MKFDLGEENLTLAGLFHCIEKFFDSYEGKGIKSVNQVLVKIGYSKYFQLLPCLTDDLMDKGKIRGFKFSIDTDLKRHEIEVVKVSTE